MRPKNVSEAWATNKRNVKEETMTSRGEETMRHIHTITIVSEYDEYTDLETLARDANQGDAILRSWSKAPAETLTEDEKEFFAVGEVEV